MANTRAEARGYDSSRTKIVSKLGPKASWAQVSTDKTFASAYIHKDGSGEVTVIRNGEIIHRFEFGPEGY